jgi:hypothetical protein
MSIKTVLYFCIALCTRYSFAVSIILDPAGDTKNPGKRIDQTCEYTETQRLAHTIKNRIAALDKKTMILLSRLPGEQQSIHEKIRFVHQCMPDMFVHLTIYQSTLLKPQIYIYRHEEKKISGKIQPLLMPIARAHAPYIQQSKDLTDVLYTSLQNNSGGMYDVHKPKSIPSSILRSITAPACIIEIGIKSIDDLNACTGELAKSILSAGKKQS